MKSLLKTKVVFLLIFSSLLAVASVSGGQASDRWHNWRKDQEKYPLACWAYFDKYGGTFQEYKTYADCNFTMVSIPEKMDHYNNATEAGLKVLIGGWQYLHKNPDILERLLTFPKAGTSEVIGYQMKDEPEPTLFKGIGTAHKTIYDKDSRNTLPICDLLPDYAWMINTRRAERFELNYDELLEEFVDKVNPAVLLNCHYAPLLDGSDREDFYANNELMRKHALVNDIGFMAFISAAAYTDLYRVPSESDFRWQAYTYLAYGAKGLWYWNWRIKPKPGVFFEGLVYHETGEPTVEYGYVKDVNAQVQKIGPLLMKLRSKNIWHSGTEVPAGTTRFPNMFQLGASVIDDFVTDDFIISEFSNQDDASDKDIYVMLVNKRHAADTMSNDPTLIADALFKPTKHYSSIYVYDSADKVPTLLKPITYQGKNGYYKIAFEGGEGKVLRFSRQALGFNRKSVNEHVRVEFARKLPVVDGKLDDAYWKKSKPLDLQVPLTSSILIKQKSQAKIIWRDNQLWVSVKLDDSDILAKGDKNGQDHYKLGDCVEIFVKPEFSDWYWEIWVNPKGNYTTLFWNKKGQKGSDAGKPYTFEMKTACTVNGTINKSGDKDTGWTVEVEIPFAGLIQDEKFLKRGQWTILVARQNYHGKVDKSHRELSSYPPLFAGRFHSVDEYSVLNLALY